MQHSDERAQRNVPARPPSVVEVPVLTPPWTAQRAQDKEELIVERTSKKRRVETPANPLNRPYRAQEDWKPDHEEERRMGTQGKPQGVKPTNTLNQPFVHSARRLQVHAGSGRHTNSAQYATKQQQLPLHGSRGRDAAKRSYGVDDPVSEQPALKRTKVTPGLVDLTGDEGQDGLDPDQGRPIPRRQVDRGSASQQSFTEQSERLAKRQKHGGDAFGNTELFDADAGLTFNMRQKSREGGDSKFGAAFSRPRTSQKRPQNEQNELQSGPAWQSTDVQSIHASASKQESTATPQSHSTRTQWGTTAPIDLMKGVNAAGQDQMRKKRNYELGSAADLNHVNRVFLEYGQKSSKATPASSIPRGPGRRTIPQAATPSGYPRGKGIASASREQYPSSSAMKLRHKFKRDVEEIEDDEEPRSSAVQPTSSRPQTRDPSPDVLEGQTTVVSQKCRAALSPQNSVALRLNKKDPESVASASDLRQTNFKRSERRSTLTRKQEPDIWQITENEDGDKRIAINRIACKAISSDRDRLALLWRPDSKDFVLVVGEELMSSPLTGKNVSIGESAVSQSWTGHDESTKVVLKGSASQSSNGKIVVEFANLDEKQRCYSELLQSFPGMATNQEYLERLDKVFANTYEMEKGAHEKSMQAKQLEINERRKQEHKHQQIEDDEIIYENDPPRLQRQKLISRMQGVMSSEANAAPRLKYSKPSEMLQRRSAALQSNGRHTIDEQNGTLAQIVQREEILASRPRTRLQESETAAVLLPSGASRRSTRQTKPREQYRELSPEVVKHTQVHGLPKWAKPIVYPKEGARRVTIDAGDILHLDAGEFLNDNIVNYALRDIEENMHPPHKDRVHFFNTFFYTSLTAKTGKRGINYDAVKKWTKNVDLLSKPYVVVPINLDLHWFVVIVYNLPAVKRKMMDSEAVEPPTEDLTLSDSDVMPEKADGTRSRLAKLALTDGLDRTEGGYTSGDGEVVEIGGSDKLDSRPITVKGRKRKRKRIMPVRKDTANQTMIISLDSFGMTRSNELRQIKQYIIDEAREKRQIDVCIDDLHGVNAKGIPQQNNFYDCGVYLIGYMREFAKDPDRFVKRILGRELDDSDFQEFDTSIMRKEIREKLLEYGNAEDRQYRDEKMARRVGRVSASNAAEVEQQPMSSQPTRHNPSAIKIGGRHNSPLAQAALHIPTEAPRSPDLTKLPTSSIFPENPYSRCETPREAMDSDAEMLMTYNTPDADNTPRTSQLSLQSSPHKDLNGHPATSPVASVYPGNANFPIGGSYETGIKVEDEVKGEDAAVKNEGYMQEARSKLGSGEAFDVESTSESDESDNKFLMTRFNDVGDEGDQNLLDDHSSDERYSDDFQGFDDKEQLIEIPDSQEVQ